VVVGGATVGEMGAGDPVADACTVGVGEGLVVGAATLCAHPMSQAKGALATTCRNVRREMV
jgi:hypothetical protein